MHMEGTSFDTRTWLKGEFASRKRKNARYSLRAFAKHVDMEASTVSQLMAGKRKASTKVLTVLCEKLGARPEVRHTLFSQLEEKAASPDLKYQLLAADAFAVLADWYHFAILELTTAEGFEGNAAWIADKLLISPVEAEVAVARLIRLGLLAEQAGSLVKTQKFLTNGSGADTSAAHRELQRQILEQAMAAIDNASPSEKDITAITMAINPAQLPTARKRIKNFRRSLCDLLETGERTQVYQLAVQLFPISKRTNQP